MAMPPMRTCGKCAAENPAGATFCMSCGTELQRSCPACGEPALAQARFCSSCGTAIAAAVEGPATAGRHAGESSAAALGAGGLESGGEDGARGEERRTVTVLFADLSGCTAIAERLDPEAVKKLVDRCLGRLGEEVEGVG